MAGEPLLTKDAINVGGHKFPIALVGGLAAVATVILIIRARSRGAGVSAGNVPASASGPYSAAATGFGGGFAPDYSAALSNIEQQLTGLGQTGLNAPTTSTPSFQVATANPGFTPGAGWQGAPGQLPLYSPNVPGGITWISNQTPLQVVGGIDSTGGIPVNFGGAIFDINPSEWNLGSSTVQPGSFRAPGT